MSPIIFMLDPLHKDLIIASNEIVFELGLSSQNLKGKKVNLTPHQKNLYFFGLKNWGLTKVRIDRICKTPPPAKIMAVLSIAFSMIKIKRYSNFTIVSQSVEAVKLIYGKKLAGLTNFILRNTIFEAQNGVDDGNNLVAKWNMPLWWIKKVKQEFGNEDDEIFLINKYHPPMALRVAYSYKKIIDLKKELKINNSKILQTGKNSLCIVPPYDIRTTQAFKSGKVSIQDLSSQKIVDFIKPKEGSSVLDVCAAPGGKTFAIAARYRSLNIIASDISKIRLNKMKVDMKRQENYLLSKPKFLVADISNEKGKRTLLSFVNFGFDYVILDAPCSGSGVVRRHPEIPWNRSPSQLKKLVKLQSTLLMNSWNLLKPNGILLYSVCSIFREEGENQIINFTKLNKSAIKIQSNFLRPTLENATDSNHYEADTAYLGSDGFFYGLVKKLCHS